MFTSLLMSFPLTPELEADRRRFSVHGEPDKPHIKATCIQGFDAEDET